MRNNLITKFILVALVLIIAGCYQGRPSEKEPIHLVPNMDQQPKYRPQAESFYFKDGATMRQPVEGTVARGELRDDVEFYFGRNIDQNSAGSFLTSLPPSITYSQALLLRGQERYDIFCSPCHGRTGNGRGIIVDRGMAPPPSFHLDHMRKYPAGQIFEVITNGIRNMPPYKYQIPVEDRWAIVAYFRALQRSQNAKLEDIPEHLRDKVN